ncbi:6334_t:CDS:2, partial [Gigaspora rosea]
MQRFLKEVPFSELHLSLNNRSKIEHMIATKRHAEHPYRQDIMGVAHMLLKQKQNNDDNLYIRSIHMSFKCVHGPINEWEVCAYVEKYQKTLVFARAFTILQTANTYQKLFEKLFTCVEQDCGHSVEFQHIHGRGIGCILADEYYGQALEIFATKKGLIKKLKKMYSLIKSKTAYEIMSTLEFFESCEEPGVI